MARIWSRTTRAFPSCIVFASRKTLNWASCPTARRVIDILLSCLRKLITWNGRWNECWKIFRLAGGMMKWSSQKSYPSRSCSKRKAIIIREVTLIRWHFMQYSDAWLVIPNSMLLFFFSISRNIFSLPFSKWKKALICENYADLLMSIENILKARLYWRHYDQYEYLRNNWGTSKRQHTLEKCIQILR